jgi:formylglycine-generating enzyme required for sulfatase activity
MAITLRAAWTTLLLLAACGSSTEAPARRPMSAAAKAQLTRDALPKMWQDLDPAHPLTRLKDPRTGIVFCRVPKGTFTMGSMSSDLEMPPHEVELTRDYLLAETEVTVAQWQLFVQEHGGNSTAPISKRSPQHPMTHLLFDEAADFCATYGYRLPTEAEWERAARGGLTEEQGPWRTQRTLSDHAWFHINSKDGPQPVATRQKNLFGLHDMLGNVWEYCSDWFVQGYGDGARITDPSGPAQGLGHTMRGGSWFTIPGPLPSLRAAEELNVTMRRGSFYGFRPARSLD